MPGTVLDAHETAAVLILWDSIRASYEVEDTYVGHLSLGTGLASVGLDSDNTLEHSPLFW